MKLFSERKKSSADDVSLVQTAPMTRNSHPFLSIDRYSPYMKKQNELYASLREAVPVIDAAITKLCRLIGTFEIKCADKNAQKQLDEFLAEVKVNNMGNGIMEFLYCYFDQLLTYGTAVGEIVLSKDRKRVCALYNASLDDVLIEKGDGALSLKVLCKKDDGSFEKVRFDELLCVSLLNPTPGTVQGNPVLKGLPFVSSVLLKIFNTIGANFERVGNVRFAVTYNPKDGASYNSKQRVQEIATQWSKAMRDKSQVCDFVSVGDVSVRVIGADNQVLSCDIEIKHLLEQIVSKLSVPPFLLGLSWSSTERMSSVQADILTSEIECYRTLLNPVIRKICRCFLRMNALSDEIEICWNNINLQDETELASARLDNARALQIENSFAEVEE